MLGARPARSPASLHDLAHAGARRPRPGLGCGVEVGDHPGEPVDNGARQLASRRHPVQLGLGREAAHLEQPLDHFAHATRQASAVRVTGSARRYSSGAVRRLSSSSARMVASRCASVDRSMKLKHTALHLPSTLPAEEDVRTVGVDPLDRLAEAAALEEGDDRTWLPSSSTA